MPLDAPWEDATASVGGDARGFPEPRTDPLRGRRGRSDGEDAGQVVRTPVRKGVTASAQASGWV